jgi:hypothetical protein
MKYQILYDTTTGQIKGSLNIYADINASIKTGENDAILELPCQIVVNPKINRIKNGQIILKPLINISVSKNIILADGVDETEITASISDCLEDELFNEVSISVSPGGTFTIPLVNNVGSIKFSCTTPGKYQFKAAESIFRTNEAEMVCNATQSN